MITLVGDVVRVVSILSIFLLVSACVDSKAPTREDVDRMFAEANKWCAQSEANGRQCAKSRAEGEARMAAQYGSQPQPSGQTSRTNGGVAYIEQSGQFVGNTQYLVMCNNGKSAKVAKPSLDWVVNGATAFGSGGMSLNAVGFSLCR